MSQEDQDERLSEKIRSLRIHGASPKYYHSIIGGNFRLDALQAAILNVKLNYLEHWIRRRQEIADSYHLLFKKSGGDGQAGFALPFEAYRRRDVLHYHTYNQFVIRVRGRDELRNFLRQKGIETAVYYPLPLHLQECFRDLGYKPGDFLQAECASRETLALPIYPEMTEDEQKGVAAAVREFYRP